MYCEYDIKLKDYRSDISFNRALCIVNFFNKTISDFVYKVLIEHYVLWIVLNYEGAVEFFKVLIEHYVLWIFRNGYTRL